MFLLSFFLFFKTHLTLSYIWSKPIFLRYRVPSKAVSFKENRALCAVCITVALLPSSSKLVKYLTNVFLIRKMAGGRFAMLTWQHSSDPPSSRVAVIWMERRQFLCYARGEREGESLSIEVLSTVPLTKWESPRHQNPILPDMSEQKKMNRFFNTWEDSSRGGLCVSPNFDKM